MHGTSRLRTLRIGALLLIFYFLAFLHALPSVSYAEAPRRIISLAPGMTEILFASGLGDRVVGVTGFCDYPEEAREKPKIGGMSNPSLEAVVSLRPDMVVMTVDGNTREFEQRLRSLNIKTFVFRELTVAGLPEGIREMGRFLDEEERFNELATDIEARMRRMQQTRPLIRKKVLYIVWPEPLIVAGPETAINDAITLLGSENIAGSAAGRYPKFSMEEILRREPEVIFIGKGKGMEEVSKGLLGRLSSLEAVKTGRVYFVSDSLYRLGPRIPQGIEEMSQHLKR